MDHRIYREKLNNKMNVLLIPLDETDTVAVGIFIKVGSRFETKKNNGISHFLEHMIFKGTKKLTSNKIYQILDNVGAIYNAQTSHESTNYYIYGHKDDIELFIGIMAEIYWNPLFREDDLITERDVVIEELNMYKDDPKDLIYDILHETLFPNSSLKFPIIGTKKNILSFTREDLFKFRRQYYLANRTAFVVTGNFDRYSISDLIKSKMGSIYKSVNNAIVPEPDPLIVTSPKIVIREKDIAQTNVMVSFRSQGIYSKDTPVYDLIGSILSGGLSSRLYNLLRNELGSTYFFNASNVSYTYEGVFIIHMGINNKRVDEVINKVLEEINGLRMSVKNKKKGYAITQGELNKAKRIIITQFSLSLQTPQDLLQYYGLQEIYYNIGPIPLDFKHRIHIRSRINEYESITIEHTNEVIRDLFRPENLNIVIYGHPPLVDKTDLI